MSFAPMAWHWLDGAFVPASIRQSPILVADSWRVHNRNMWGLTDHLHRFTNGLHAQSGAITQIPDFDIEDMQSSIANLIAQLPSGMTAQALFPRLSYEQHPTGQRLVLLLRPAPTVRTTTTLWVPNTTDPRINPTVKGPDIGLLRSLVDSTDADDVVLHNGTTVHETTTGALLVWPTPGHLVLCQAEAQLASISAQRIAHYASQQNIQVTRRKVSLNELTSGRTSVWFTNTLHGISPVTVIASESGQHNVPQHPKTRQWQNAWWEAFQPTPPGISR